MQTPINNRKTNAVTASAATQKLLLMPMGDVETTGSGAGNKRDLDLDR
jgi:hypothetical protein